MEIKQLQMEILEAERLIDRNKMILALNEQAVGLQKQVESLTAENSELKSNVAATVAEVL